MGRRLRLQKFGLHNVNYLYLGAARLRVEATDPERSGADPNVFLWLRSPARPEDGTVVDFFQGVASPVDMSDYPPGEPSERTAYPFFRTAEFEIDLRALSLVEECWDTVVREVGVLLNALDIMEDRLGPTESVDVGTPNPAAPGSGSSGSSASV